MCFSSFSVPQGPDAEAALQKLCTNNMAVAPGSIVYTGMLNQQGGYQTDCTVTRLSQNKLVHTLSFSHCSPPLPIYVLLSPLSSLSFPSSFLLRYLAVCPASHVTHMATWISRHLPPSVTLRDITPHYAVLGVMGPQARDVLQRLTKTPLNNESFPFATAQVDSIMCCCIRAFCHPPLLFSPLFPRRLRLDLLWVCGRCGSATWGSWGGNCTFPVRYVGVSLIPRGERRGERRKKKVEEGERRGC